MSIRNDFIAALIAIGFLLFAGSLAQAAPPTCANIRCSDGSCIETPEGPVCTSNRLTCASTLCERGNTCVETTSGPQCVTNTRPSPHPNYTPWPHYVPRPSYHHYGWQPRPYYHSPYNYWTPRPYYRPHWGYGWHQPSPPIIQPPIVEPPHSGPVPEPQGCFAIYKPVCAQKQVQCVRAPCPPIQRTFGNACEAAREGFSVIHRGTCQ